MSASRDPVIPSPFPGDRPPPRWSFAEGAAVWQQEGSVTGATLPEDANGLWYTGTVTHFSRWNADRQCDGACVTVVVLDELGKAMASAGVTAKVDTTTCARIARNMNLECLTRNTGIFLGLDGSLAVVPVRAARGVGFPKRALLSGASEWELAIKYSPRRLELALALDGVLADTAKFLVRPMLVHVDHSAPSVSFCRHCDRGALVRGAELPRCSLSLQHCRVGDV